MIVWRNTYYIINPINCLYVFKYVCNKIIYRPSIVIIFFFRFVRKNNYKKIDSILYIYSIYFP